MRATERWLWCVNKVLNLQCKPHFHVGRHSRREAEEGDVAVLEDVFFAFEPVFAGVKPKLSASLSLIMRFNSARESAES